jgi:hypothetical protein
MMYSIKAEFDGTKIRPKEPVPVKAQSRPKENSSLESLLDFAGIFDREDVAIIEEIIRERREPAAGKGIAVS